MGDTESEPVPANVVERGDEVAACSFSGQLAVNSDHALFWLR